MQLQRRKRNTQLAVPPRAYDVAPGGVAVAVRPVQAPPAPVTGQPPVAPVTGQPPAAPGVSPGVAKFSTKPGAASSVVRQIVLSFALLRQGGARASARLSKRIGLRKLSSVTTVSTPALPPAPTLTYGTPASGTTGTAYSLTPTTTGSGVTFSLTSGTLPTSLSLNSSTGEISGTPSSAATFSDIEITASNAGGSVTDTFDITIAAGSYKAAVAAAAELYLDVVTATLYKGIASGGGEATLNGDSVLTIIPTTATWDSGNGTVGAGADQANDPTLQVGVSEIRAGRTIQFNQNQEVLNCRTAAGVTDATNIISTTKHWGAACFRLSASDSDQIARIDSFGQLRIETADNGDGTADVSLCMDINGVGEDEATIVKTIAYGSIVTLTWFYDGTDLHWKFDADAAGESLSFAGTLAALGTGGSSPLYGRTGMDWDLSLIVIGKANGSGLSDADMWTLLANHHDEIYAEVIASYDPDNDGLGADLYILANAGDITEAGTGVDTWVWRNTNAGGAIFKQGTDGSRPSYNATGILAKPCVTFNGSTDLMLGRNAGNTADILISQFLAASAVGVVLVVFATGTVQSTSSTVYNNDTIIGDDSGGSFGITLHNNTTDYDFRAFNYTGEAPHAEVKFSLSAGVVGMYRKPSDTKHYVSVNGGSEGEVASGAVASVGYGVQIGDTIGEEFTGEIYCIMGWKSAPANLAEIISNLMTYYGIS